MLIADTPADKLPGYQELSIRLKNRLKKLPKEGSILKLKDIIKITENDLLKINGLGQLCVSEMRKWRGMVEAKMGLQMNDDLIAAAEEVLQLKQHYVFKKESAPAKALNYLEQVVRDRKHGFLLNKKDVLTVEDRIKKVESAVEEIKKKIHLE